MTFNYYKSFRFDIKKSIHVPLKIDMKYHKDPMDKGPYFKLIMDEKSEYTVNNFINAMKDKSIEDARVYLSKDYIDTIDLNKLQSIFENINHRFSPFVIKASYESGPKNCITNTVLAVDKKLNSMKIFHIYMLREPDRFGKWKIYGIEQE